MLQEREDQSACAPALFTTVNGPKLKTKGAVADRRALPATLGHAPFPSPGGPSLFQTRHGKEINNQSTRRGQSFPEQTPETHWAKEENAVLCGFYTKNKYPSVMGG